jgi:hypothetical protein
MAFNMVASECMVREFSSGAWHASRANEGTGHHWHPFSWHSMWWAVEGAVAIDWCWVLIKMPAMVDVCKVISKQICGQSK